MIIFFDNLTSSLFLLIFFIHQMTNHFTPMFNKIKIGIFFIFIWLITIILLMIITHYFDFFLFFGLGFFGLLIMSELTNTIFVKPNYTRNLRYVIITGLIIFGYLMFLKYLVVYMKFILLRY